MINIVNCHKNKSEVRPCFTVSVRDGVCSNQSCTWNEDRAKGNCLYVGRAILTEDIRYRIYIKGKQGVGGNVYVLESDNELDVIRQVCEYCDIEENCDRFVRLVNIETLKKIVIELGGMRTLKNEKV